VSSQTRARVLLIAVPVGLLLIAAALRLPDLATRGTWDSDQGHDMLVLRGLVRDGVIPLLGPPTSIGDVHHGAWYYYLLSPAALLTGGDSPLAVTVLIALSGIAAVLVTWWLARDIGGPVAGLVAGLAMAVSASAVDESTFIWNPNLIALSSAIALTGAWRAWTTGRPRWWLLAGAGTAVTMQCHVLGVTLLPIIGALLVADARGRPPGVERRSVWRYGLVGLAIVVLSFVPLVVHELTNDFSEVAAALDYLRSGGDPASIGPIGRFFIVGARVVSWPLVALLTDAPTAALVGTVAVVAIAVWCGAFGAVRERQAARWLGFGLLWTAGFLTFASPSLATVVPGLPNDHYHAFADPMVFVLVGMGAGVLWRGGARAAATETPARARMVGRAAAVVGVVALLGFNLLRQPPAVHPDGGFPAADVAAARIMDAGGDTLTLRSLPDFKSTEAYAYPLVRAGATVTVDAGSGPVTTPDGTLVLVCDDLFAEAIGAQCGGSAESTVAPADRFGTPVDRFEAAPGRWISVYRGAIARTD
jgi:4-amino-4-deoxy-L-arabinose transferase-like glycosyltransferase